eukprot:jgi/Psemu1/30800/gm1.30800_g
MTPTQTPTCYSTLFWIRKGVRTAILQQITRVTTKKQANNTSFSGPSVSPPIEGMMRVHMYRYYHIQTPVCYSTALPTWNGNCMAIEWGLFTDTNYKEDDNDNGLIQQSRPQKFDTSGSRYQPMCYTTVRKSEAQILTSSNKTGGLLSSNIQQPSRCHYFDKDTGTDIKQHSSAAKLQAWKQIESKGAIGSKGRTSIGNS